MNEIEEQIYTAVKKVKNIDVRGLAPETRFDSLGITSLELITIIFELEDAYNITIVAAELDDFKTLGEAKNLVAGLVAKREATAGMELNSA